MITIDSAQGREFDVVFVSMTRTTGGAFIEDVRRINVALTRARHGLVIVGNARVLAEASTDWKALLTEMKDHIVDGLEGAVERFALYKAKQEEEEEDLEYDFM